MPTKKKTSKRGAVRKQTVNKRRNGQFAKGNTLGNRWRKGESGNPAGRPRDTITPHLRELARRKRPGADDRTQGELVAQMLFDEAIDKNNVQAARTILDRLDGGLKQTIDVTVEQRKRELFENAVAALVAETKMSRDEAVEQLLQVMPEANQWVN